ncbi:hypothetical protein LRP67_15635 [Nocardioides sp. cx-169]|uniref:hypothetical protein n=1 Tax=Nocardioides sp. cx-169 TaxID=2899080 RepID=UPI001E3C9FE8|nr:hypothetical protein [Nocardioides sp. cx-169]MCD4535522.1 hypothetical protein [Nocardioides sp. cx-169]
MRKLLRGCAFVTLGAAVVLACVYLVHGLVGQAALSKAKDRASADIAEKLPAAREVAAQDRERVRSRLDTLTAGRPDHPAHSWTELVCDISSMDAGWVVQSYSQKCHLRTVDAIPLEGPADDGATPAGAESSADRECVSTPPEPGAVDVTSRVSIHRGPATAYDADEPHREGCPDDIFTPADRETTRPLNGTRPAGTEDAHSWLVLTIETPVSHIDLGCDPWVPLLCASPLDAPVLGDGD